MSIEKPKLAGAACARLGCRGVLWCANSIPSADGLWMIRLYACNVCGCRPADNKRRVPMEYSQRRAG